MEYNQTRDTRVIDRSNTGQDRGVLVNFGFEGRGGREDRGGVEEGDVCGGGGREGIVVSGGEDKYRRRRRSAGEIYHKLLRG